METTKEIYIHSCCYDILQNNNTYIELNDSIIVKEKALLSSLTAEQKKLFLDYEQEVVALEYLTESLLYNASTPLAPP